MTNLTRDILIKERVLTPSGRSRIWSKWPQVTLNDLKWPGVICRDQKTQKPLKVTQPGTIALVIIGTFICMGLIILTRWIFKNCKARKKVGSECNDPPPDYATISTIEIPPDYATAIQLPVHNTSFKTSDKSWYYTVLWRRGLQNKTSTQ